MLIPVDSLTAAILRLDDVFLLSRLAGLAATHGLHAAGGGVRLPAPPPAAARARGGRGHQRRHRLTGIAHFLKGPCHEMTIPSNGVISSLGLISSLHCQNV